MNPFLEPKHYSITVFNPWRKQKTTSFSPLLLGLKTHTLHPGRNHFPANKSHMNPLSEFEGDQFPKELAMPTGELSHSRSQLLCLAEFILCPGPLLKKWWTELVRAAQRTTDSTTYWMACVSFPLFLFGSLHTQSYSHSLQNTWKLRAVSE